MRKNILLVTDVFILILSLLGGTGSFSYSQSRSSVIDSLKKELGNSQNAVDSISVLCRLCWEINWSKPDQTFRYGMTVLILTGSAEDKEQLAEIYDAVALGYWVKGDLVKARELYNKALDIGNKHNLGNRIAWENYNLAALSIREKKYEEAYQYASKSKEVFKELKKTQFIPQCDLLLNRARNFSAKIIQSLIVSDSLSYELDNAKTAADSASILCWVIWSIERPEPEQLLKYGLKVLELSGRVSDKERLAEIYDAAALSYRINTEYEESKKLYHKALTIGEKYNFIDRIAWENYNLASLSLEEGKYKDVLKYGLESRKAFRTISNIDMVINSDWFLIKANYNNYIDSTVNDIKLAIDKTNDPNILLKHYFNIIYLYGQKENKTQSMLYAMKALEKAEELNNQKGILSAYYQIGDYLRDYQHNYEIALLYYGKILDIYKKNKNEAGIAGVLNEIGNVQKLTGNDSLAMSYFYKSLKIAEKVSNTQIKVDAYKYIGEIYYKNKKFSDALNYFLKSYHAGYNDCSPVIFHQVLINLGKGYLNMKDYKNSLKFFNISLHFADSVNINSERAVSYSALGDLYLTDNNVEKAEGYFQTALDKALLANSLSLQKEIANKLSNVYMLKNNFRKAYEYLALSNEIADSLNKISDAENLARLETKFEFQNLKIQKENELRENKLIADSEIKKQQQLKYFFIIAFILTTVLGLVIYFGFRRKKKDSMLLEKQKRKIEEMSEKVHLADQKKLNFFTNISHEFRTPLSLILGPVERLLKNNSVNGNTRPLLNIVYKNTLQLYNLINQLLEIRKLDAGSVKLRVSEKDILNYLRGIYSTFLNLAEENQIKYNFNCEDKEIICWFDHDILEKVLNNLLSNAFKYTRCGGEINFNVSACKKQNEISEAVIVIRDDGKGIPEDQLRYIFDRYYQVENINDGYNTGTGIGLAYTKELIEVHKGEINVESKINSGTFFTIKLPVNDSCYSAEEKVKGEEKVNETENENIMLKYLSASVPLKMGDNDNANDQNNLNGSSKNFEEENHIMLIVEDNDDLREFIKSIFNDSYKIYEAIDGVEGYELANKIIPDIIISDIMMPQMNGIELCTKLKQNINTNHIPVLILTAKTGEENEIEGLKTGADDYLTKPFNSEILKIRINRLLESREKLKEYFTRNFLLKPKEIKPASPEDEFLLKAVKVVENNIVNPDLNVEFLMNELAVSRTQLFRKLKALTNYSANQFIRNIKLKKAAQLLQDKSNNITDVVYLSGFNSPSYFTACFKEMYGCLPKEYHAKYQHASSQISF